MTRLATPGAGRLGDAPHPSPRTDPGSSVVRRRRRALLLALLALTVLGGGGGYLVYGSSLLRAEHVKVSGNSVLTDHQIVSAAKVPLGGALFSVDTGAVSRRLTAALPRIDHVDVERSWPHTVALRITERTPSAVLKKGGGFTEVDRDGVRFATVARAPRGVPLVQLTDPQPASVRQFGTRELLRGAIEVSAELPRSLDGHATAIRVRSYDGITVELSGGREVVWGSAADGARKARVLTALMKAQPDATHYDVSAPTAPAASGS
ncbi:putative cell division septal protein [Actinacidiphila reveromycinica]|uniref:Cell division protein FtsQ n=1 Tax=Actinacidiphila reveromycinica TaxID=659352 RepID=A0A7U3UQF4_9ACTN|nr:FtsQ-type POTRA domain-containing protein [Streptomyces sp. SN-593]BBA96766.1 putative cell division septal protein [Streptomyces sp. SN-593]